ncbi:MAG TPA: signal peptide peptidase SppA [Phycisphaerae bacterium]|nr:signal peptide peptidase SppA [Phycisphaerae bacterium]
MKRSLITALLTLSLLTSSALPTFAAGDTTIPATIAAPAPKARIALIKLSDQLLERPKSFTISLASLSGNDKSQSLSTLIVTLDKAKKDTALSGLLLDLSAFSLTLNQSQELGTLITDLRHAGKRVAVYSSDYDTATYLLASYADTIIMPENGNILIPGVGLQMVFFKGTLDKLNLQPDFVQIGKYKGAEEPFMRTSASDEYRAQINKLVDGMYSEITSTIATNRPNLDEAAVKKAIDEAWLTGKHAREIGLVDQTLTRDKVNAWLDSQFPNGAQTLADYGKPKTEAIDMNNPFAIFSLFGEKPKPRITKPAIAVIYAVGEIVPDFVNGEDSDEYVTPGGIRNAVEKAMKDDNVKAIVLRVDSPGGSASASDEIWSVLHDADKKKPVTISMGRVAASGGYYISCSGRSITADPATITGSIGVVAGKIVIKGLTDKIGLNIEPVTRGQHAMMLSAMTPFSDEERQFLTKSMTETYGVFTSRVTGARGDKIPKLEDVAQGRLFTGIQAKDAGLVDNVGTLNDAILAAATSAHIEKNFQIEVLPEPKTFADILRESLMSDVKAPLVTGIDMNPLSSLFSQLPPELRATAKSAQLMLTTMQHDHIMLTMPLGLVETVGSTH